MESNSRVRDLRGKARRGATAVAFALVFLLCGSYLQAHTYYVDAKSAAASDGNAGTEDSPWKTIHKANRSVEAGDTVVVKAGVYHDWICPDAVGDEDNWIVYRSEPPYGAILDGWVELDSVAVDEWRHVSPDTGNIWLRELRSSAFIEAWMDSTRLAYPFPYTCDTLRFAPGRSYVDSTKTLYVWLLEGETPFGHRWHVTLKNGVWLFPRGADRREKYLCVEGFQIRNFGLNGIAVSQDYVHIKNNKVYRNGRAGIGVSFCDHVLVEGNEAYENCTGIGFSQGITAYSVFGTDVVFARNVSHDNFDGADPEHCGSDGNGFVLDTCPPQGGAVFVNNVAYRNMGGGFGVYQACHGIFVNNTSFRNGLKGPFGGEVHVTGTGEYASNHLLFRNNIFAGRGGERKLLHVTYAAANPPKDVVFDHNLYYRPGADSSTDLFEVRLRSARGDLQWELDLPGFQDFSVSYEGVTFEPGWGEGSLVADPLLVDWHSGDFCLLEGSPAIDAGVAESAPSADFYGTPRPQGGGVDLGACEMASASAVLGRGEGAVVELGTYPNPFNSSVTIRYSLKKPARVNFVVRDVLGRIVDEKVYKGQRPGVHKITWGGTDASGSPLASGVYLLSVRTGEFERTVRVLLLK